MLLATTAGFRSIVHTAVSRFWANVVVTLMCDDDGKLIVFSKVTRDLTERKRAEDALKALNESLEKHIEERTQQLSFEKKRLQDIFINAPVAICFQEGPEYVYVLQNAGYTSLIGGRNLIGMPIRKALPELKGQEFYEILDKVYSTGVAFHGTKMPANLRQADGKIKKAYFDFTYDPWRDEKGNIKGILTIASDVTSRVAANQEREVSVQRNSFLVEASTILATSLDYRLTLNQLAKIAAIHEDSTRLHLIDELSRYYPANSDTSKGIAYVIESGKSIFSPKVCDSELVAAAKDERHLQIMRDLV